MTSMFLQGIYEHWQNITSEHIGQVFWSIVDFGKMSGFGKLSLLQNTRATIAPFILTACD